MGAVNIRQDDDGYMGLVGEDSDDGSFVFASAEYTATSVDKTIAFTAPRALRVVGITGRVTVAGTDAGAVTATVRKVPSGTAIASGTALHTGTMNLKGTADTNQTLTLSTTAGVLDIPAGTSIALDVTGVLTAATGLVTVALCLK